jgi:hypothetical protein
VREDLLRADREAHRLLRRKRQGLVHAVRVERLRAAEHRREGLDRDAHRVVLRLLGRQGDPGGLRVEPQVQGFRLPRVESVSHDRAP